MGTVGRALADVAPHDISIAVNNEHRWRRISVAQEVVHSVGLGHLVVRISQYGIGGLDHPAYTVIHCGQRGDRQCHNFGSRILEGLVLRAQLDQLRSVRPSSTPFEEDENDGPLLQLVC